MSVPPEVARTLDRPAAVYVLIGDAGLLVQEAAEAVRAAALAGGMAAFNHAVFTAGEEGAAIFPDSCRQAPVMAPRRLVELRQVQDAPVAVLDALLEYVQKPVDGTVLMVVGDRMPAASGGVDRGLRIVNAVKKGGCFYKAEGKSADPLAIARGRAGLWRATVDAKAVQKLRELGGDDIDVLAANVDLCAGYVGEGGAITALVVDTVCASTAEASVWRLTDAIVAREPNGALAELHRLLDDGEPPHKLLSTIGWQMRQVLLVQDASRRQLPPGEAGVRMQPDKLRMVRQVCEQRPVSPSGWLEELAAVNRRMNSSRAGDRRAIEDFVLRLATS